MLDVTALKTYFVSHREVVFACLFGSHARGQAGTLSDVDVAVLFDHSVEAGELFDRQLQIGLDVGSLLGTNDVDVVVLNDAPLALAYRVLRDGILLACHDEDERILFVARIYSLYLDFAPFLERHERAIVARATRGELLNGYNTYRGALERYRQLRERIAGTGQTDLR